MLKSSGDAFYEHLCRFLHLMTLGSTSPGEFMQKAMERRIGPLGRELKNGSADRSVNDNGSVNWTILYQIFRDDGCVISVCFEMAIKEKG